MVTKLKISQYADDTAAIVNNIKSAEKKCLESVKIFCTYSGLNMNKDKSEGYWVGSL